jgi:signal recognition particle receptor subunit beta
MNLGMVGVEGRSTPRMTVPAEGKSRAKCGFEARSGFRASLSCIVVLVASLNPLTRELVFKLVFYGPGLGGKTTTLQFIHATTRPEHRGKMVSLATPTDRTLYFDFLPLRMPRIRGMSVRLQLFTVPGQVYYGQTRKLVLSGVDGVVFVADSQAGRMDANNESLEDLNANLVENNRTLAQLPHTLHWNKRDLSDLVPIEELDRRFNLHGAPSLGTCATRGDGVFEGLERITRLVLRQYESELPKNEQPVVSFMAGGAESSIAEAIRGLTEPPIITKITPFAGMPAVKVPPAPAPQASSVPQELPPSLSPGAAAAPAVSFPLPAPMPASMSAPVPAAMPSPPLDNGAPPPRETSPPPAPAVETGTAHAVVTIAPPPGTSHFSMAELWPEAEREAVRQTETLIGARDAHGAVLACDLILTRLLASAAGLAGALDAPRDPGLVSLLLGLDGRRYISFRATVRAARQKEEITIREALDCFAFVVEARQARDSLRRG